MTQTHQHPKLYKFRASHSLDFTLGTASPPARDRGKSATQIKRHRKWLGLTWHEWLTVETDAALIERLQSDVGQLDFETAIELFNSWESQIETYVTAGETEKASKLERLLLKLVPKLDSLPSASPDPLWACQMPLTLPKPVNNENLIENNQSEQGFQTRAKRGTKGISPAAKRKIKSCGVLLEEKFRRINLAFVTCTLPTLSESQLKRVCENWSDLVREFFRALTRMLERKNLSTDYVQVTEIQEKRFKQWGQVCPHLHFVFQGRLHSREQWRVSPADIQFLWQRSLENLLGEKLDCRYATRIENPRKSLSKELGKYLTKGGKVLKEILDRGMSEFLPSSWYGVSRVLSRLERSKRIERVGEVATYLLQNLERLAEANEISFRRLYVKLRCPVTGIESEICVGVTGWFTSRAALNRVLNMQSHCVRKFA